MVIEVLVGESTHDGNAVQNREFDSSIAFMVRESVFLVRVRLFYDDVFPAQRFDDLYQKILCVSHD